MPRVLLRLCFATTSLIVPARLLAHQWNVSTLPGNASRGYGAFNSIAVFNDRPMISYSNGNDLQVKLARWTGSSWSVELIGGGAINSLALDAQGRPNIAYREENTVKWASHNGSAWTTRTAFSGHSSDGVSIAVDAQGRPHIAYVTTFGPNDLRYAHWTGSAWVHRVVASNVWYNGGGYTSSSIALDAQGNPHIAYGAQDFLLRYASLQSNGQWTSEVVPGPTNASYASLRIGSDDRPHIVYRDFVPGVLTRLGYATRDGNGWIATIADYGDGHSVGYNTSLVLDSNDRPHVGYWDGSYANMKYAMYDGAQWSTEFVELGQVGWFTTSIAVDSLDRPHLSYYWSPGGFAGALRYATIIPEPTAALGLILLTPLVASRRRCQRGDKST